MATYKEIKGVTVQTRDEDPTVNAGTWASGGSLNTARQSLKSAGVTQNGALGFGGNTGSIVSITESYNGSTWTEVNDLNTARWDLNGFGSYTAAIAAAGVYDVNAVLPTNAVESWNGSSWTEVAEMNTTRQNGANLGTTNTAGLVAGGSVRPGSPPGTPVSFPADNELWNGSAWTEVNNLNTGRAAISGFGTSTSGIGAAGTPPTTNAVESWDGTSWTEVSEVNTARYNASSTQGTDNTSGMIFGGYSTTRVGSTETWDGSSWTEVNDLSTARNNGGGAGTGTTDALMFGGQTPSATDATEEWSFPSGPHLNEGDIFLSGGTTLKAFGKAAGIPAATFASGGSLNTARGYHGGAGTDHEALLAFGGTTGTAVNNVEQYNGSSWSEVAEINTTRANLTGFGSSTAAIAGNGSTPDKSQVENWNGSAWTEIAELNTSRSDSASAGIQTSGMVATGTPVPGNPALQPGGTSTVTETWDGTSWTEVGDTNTKRLQAGMAVSGTTSAGIIAAGEDGPGSRTVNAETWNGTSWTEVSNISQQRGTIYNFMGNSTSANMAGGYSGTARVANNEHWNGSSWTEINDLSTARNAAFGAGSAVNGAVFGGDTGDYQSATEEFIADNALSTVTVS